MVSCPLVAVAVGFEDLVLDELELEVLVPDTVMVFMVVIVFPTVELGVLLVNLSAARVFDVFVRNVAVLLTVRGFVIVLHVTFLLISSMEVVDTVIFRVTK